MLVLRLRGVNFEWTMPPRRVWRKRANKRYDRSFFISKSIIRPFVLLSKSRMPERCAGGKRRHAERRAICRWNRHAKLTGQTFSRDRLEVTSGRGRARAPSDLRRRMRWTGRPG